MKDKVVFITGANGGLGSSVTRAFLQQGARVIGGSLRITAADFPQPNFEAMAIDFNKLDEIKRGVAKIVERHGHLDVLVHVLGGFAGGPAIAETSDEMWEQMQNINLTSAFHVFRESIPHLRKSKAGRLIAIGSLTAAQPHANLGAYVTFKAALAMLVQTVALENADAGLTANVILPGTMDTPVNRKSMPDADFSKWAKTDDVAELALSLADEQARHLTGLAIPIEGSRG
ncbi:MAG TPA: SDR family NAD(P)-dependent oxidoreductase [Candidatus Acidoferrales bacterium]|jgi:NAD(P)-dependent dehydrogenase (short-subunit alcohol dehydrogenase family)|nr:SDR family NAD(P)-dependent oxidoreductase [Candidatus Acidoferrales bacterium]